MAEANRNTNHTINSLLNFASNKLNKTIDRTTALIQVRILLKFTLGVDNKYIIMHMHDHISQTLYDKFMGYLSRRIKGEPVEYITNIKEFYGIEFYVDNRVLIPRYDTELLVDVIIKYITGHYGIKKNNTNKIRLLDIGTGSGNIPISILLTLASKYNIEITATDLSNDAINIAKHNAHKHGLNQIKFCIGNIYEPLTMDDKFDIIASNPPYIALEDQEVSHETLNYEPHQALFAPENGLFFYNQIIKNAKKYLRQDGRLFLEIGHKQLKEVEYICKTHNMYIENVFHDIQGKERAVQIKFKN